MSDDGREPGPEPAAVPRPAPSPSTGNVIGGVFLIGCGACLVLVGGGCTFLFVMMMSQTHSPMGGELLLPAVLLIVGVVALILGIRLVTKRQS